MPGTQALVVSDASIEGVPASLTLTPFEHNQSPKICGGAMKQLTFASGLFLTIGLCGCLPDDTTPGAESGNVMAGPDMAAGSNTSGAGGASIAATGGRNMGGGSGTEVTGEIGEDESTDDSRMGQLQAGGSTEDVANVVIFLSSDLANYITGETIHVNGGMYLG